MTPLYPDCEGVWHWVDTDGIATDVDVYLGPNDALCVWCEDIGMASYEQTITVGDEMMGHVMAHLLAQGTWTYLRLTDHFPHDHSSHSHHSRRSR